MKIKYRIIEKNGWYILQNHFLFWWMDCTEVKWIPTICDYISFTIQSRELKDIYDIVGMERCKKIKKYIVIEEFTI